MIQVNQDLKLKIGDKTIAAKVIQLDSGGSKLVRCTHEDIDGASVGWYGPDQIISDGGDKTDAEKAELEAKESASSEKPAVNNSKPAPGDPKPAGETNAPGSDAGNSAP